MQYLLVILLTHFVTSAASAQCEYAAEITSNVNNMEVNGKTTRLNLNGQIQIGKDSITIQQEILGQVIRYRYKIVQTECSAWKTDSHTGMLVFMVQQVGSDKPYEGKIILEKAENNRVITLLDSKEGKYQVNYEKAQIKEL